MPEYLAPGVYVEEVSTGSKPIEGVSTSTTGLAGVTERGPVSVPQLVTSRGEYRKVAVLGAVAVHVSLGLPLQLGHAIGAKVRHVSRTADPAYTAGITLSAAAIAGQSQIAVTSVAADITNLVALTPAAPEL